MWAYGLFEVIKLREYYRSENQEEYYKYYYFMYKYIHIHTHRWREREFMAYFYSICFNVENNYKSVPWMMRNNY